MPIRTDSILCDVCDRNQALELHYETPEGEHVVARSRFLSIGPQGIDIDELSQRSGAGALRRNQIVEVYFLANGALFRFRAKVTSPKKIVSINEHQRTLGVRLAKPGAIRLGQRRRHYRVSVIGEEPVPVELRSVTGDEPTEETLRATPDWTGELIDLSISGAAVRFRRCGEDGVEPGSQVAVTFRLPDDPGFLYKLFAEVRLVQSLPNPSDVRAGLQFRRWPDERTCQAVEDRLQRFITATQRAQLKRAG